MNETPQNDQSRINLLILIGSCLCLFFFLLQVSGFYHDDSYITLRYVKNFLDGKGLVWNCGERVEGYTCFFWVILTSLLGYFNIDLVLATKILGIGFAFLTLLLFFLFERKKINAGNLLLSTNSCFALWAVGGLETVAFGFFVFLGCCLFLKKCYERNFLFLTGIVFCLAAMTRPEGMIFFGFTLFFSLVKKGKLNAESLTNAAMLAAGFLAFYLPYFFWRIDYYGHFFPCTFYAKGGTNFFKILFGIRYTFYFLLMFGLPLVILFFVKDKLLFFASRIYLSTLLLCYFLYVIFLGGDHMPGYRFLIPILPLFYLLIQEALEETTFKKKTVPFWACLLLIACLNFIISYGSIPRGPEANRACQSRSDKFRNCFYVPDQAAYVGKIVGNYMKKNWPHDATVACNTAGSTPYFSGIATFVDMLGLNDYTIAQREISYDFAFVLRQFANPANLLTSRGRRRIIHTVTQRYLVWQIIPGHGKADGLYVLSRKPDYIILGPTNGGTKPLFLGDKEILSSPDFKKDYRLKRVVITINDKLFLFYKPTQTGTLILKYYEREKADCEPPPIY